jgi:hypothetical protein
MFFHEHFWKLIHQIESKRRAELITARRHHFAECGH